LRETSKKGKFSQPESLGNTFKPWFSAIETMILSIFQSEAFTFAKFLKLPSKAIAARNNL
jgi:hypothetical protein